MSWSANARSTISPASSISGCDKAGPWRRSGSLFRWRAKGKSFRPPSFPTLKAGRFASRTTDSSEGTLARFLQNQLKLLFWYRPASDPQLVFGAQVNLVRLLRELQTLFQIEPNLQKEITVALLDDAERPRLTSNAKFHGNWKR